MSSGAGLRLRGVLVGLLLVALLFGAMWAWPGVPGRLMAVLVLMLLVLMMLVVVVSLIGRMVMMMMLLLLLVGVGPAKSELLLVFYVHPFPPFGPDAANDDDD